MVPTSILQEPSHDSSMLKLNSENSIDFGTVSRDDDLSIEIIKPKNTVRNEFWLETARLVRDIVLVGAVLGLFVIFIAQPVIVDGSSMEPQLHDGERLIVNKLVHYNLEKREWGHVSRGDIVVFWYPEDPAKSFVKRIIGMPGETIESRGGKVYIDGKILSEPYLVDKQKGHMRDFGPQQVSRHHYFVMGDNRMDSSDSREWGLVPEKYIYGRVFFRWWRPARFGKVNKNTIDYGDAVGIEGDSQSEY